MDRGRLFLVVGPSGVGKDSIIDGLRGTAGRQTTRFVFPRRHITRDTSPRVASRTSPITRVEPSRRCAPPMPLPPELGGPRSRLWRFAWTSATELEAGASHVVVNVSRAVIEPARHRSSTGVRAARSTLPMPRCATRLLGRGRESPKRRSSAASQRARAYAVAGDGRVHHRQRPRSLEAGGGCCPRSHRVRRRVSLRTACVRAARNVRPRRGLLVHRQTRHLEPGRRAQPANHSGCACRRGS